MLLAIAILGFLGAIQPESYPIIQVGILIPAAFLGSALLLIGLPLLLSERVENNAIPWAKVREFLMHNNALFIAIALLLAAISIILALNWSGMSIVERGIFLGALALGTLSALREQAVGINTHDSG